jgi:hypothetical protein
MKIKIEVTEDDIMNGWPGSSRRCPIALACKRVSKIEGLFDLNWKNMDPEIKGKLNAFISVFDAMKPVSPFTAEIDIPDRFLHSYHPDA